MADGRRGPRTPEQLANRISTRARHEDAWNLARRCRQAIEILGDVKRGGQWHGEDFDAPPVLTPDAMQNLRDLLRDMLAYFDARMP